MQAAANTPIKVMLIDDDDVDREKIRRLLGKLPMNLAISEGSSAKDALLLINNQIFNCAIIDYQLKDSLGSELVESIKKHNSEPTPIIMVSGNSDERVIANVIRDGVFDYLPKRSLAPDQLYQTLLQSLKWARNESLVKEQRLRVTQLTEGLPQMAWTCTADGSCDFLNRRWYEFTGRNESDQLGYGWLEQVHPQDKEQFVSAWTQCVRSGEELHINLRIRNNLNEYRWFDTRATPQRDTSGNIIRWLGSNTDITDIEITRQALATSEKRFHAAFDYAPLGMTLVNLGGTILQANASFHALLGFELDKLGQLSALTGTSIMEISHPDDIEAEKAELRELQSRNIPFVQFEKRLLARDLHVVHTQVSVALINSDAQPPCYLFQYYDLSERKRYEERLIQLAHFDPLTGLGNRTKLYEEISFLVQKSARSAAPFAILFGDLDHFKEINDGLGHEAGDLLLRIVARRLRKSVRRGDSVARLGGDEFVIIMQDVNKFEAVVTVAEKLIQRIKRPIRLGNNVVHVGISFGVALYPTDGDDAQTLLRNADSALYEAKKKGRGCHQLYRKELTEYVHNRLMLDADIRNALLREEFELYFQPVINLSTQTIESVEALIRWHHPVRGMVPPDEFIGYAQESGLINRIGEWVIQAACRRAALWRAQGHELAVAINISARQFYQSNLLELIQHALAANNLSPTHLILEITEQMFLENTQDNIRQINELKAAGLRISLDDFGTGFSSLGYILRFAPYYLKVDRSFVRQIGTGEEHDAMVKAIIGLNQILPMKVVAEGVETDAQEAFLRERGCGLVQGYRYAKPLPADQLIPLFEQLGITPLAPMDAGSDHQTPS